MFFKPYGDGSFRKILAGLPATMACAGTSFVTTLPAPTMACSPMVTLASRVTLEPMEAPFLTTVGSTFQSTSVWRPPAALVARGIGPVVAAAVILPALALTTWSQLPYWYDDVTLFQHAIASTSENPIAEYHLGKDFADLGRNAEAIPHLREMIRMEPAYAQAYYMLGNAQAGQSDDASAIRSFSDALRLKPNYAEAYYARATLTIKANNPVAAETDLRNAINCGLAPEWEAQAHNGLGVILGERGNLPAAVSEFQQAVRVQPEMMEEQRNLAQTLAAQGRVREAVSQLNQALIATHGDPSIRQLLYSLMPPGGGPPAEPATAPRGH